MTDMTTPASRQPQGIPVGGQFAPTAHAEPSVALATVGPLTPEQFKALMTEDLAGKIDANLKGKLRDNDPESNLSIEQPFESEPDEDGMYVCTKNPVVDDWLAYSVAVVDGKAQIRLFNDEYDTGVEPRELIPEKWAGPDEAAKEIADSILGMEGEVSDALSGRGGSPDGFSSDAEYRRWRER